MSARQEKKIRKIVHRSYKFEYDKLIATIQTEPVITKIRWLFGIGYRVLFIKNKG